MGIKRAVDLDGHRWQKKVAFLQTEAGVNTGKEAGCKGLIAAVFRIEFLAATDVQVLFV